MDRETSLHPWVASIRNRVTFGLQAIAQVAIDEVWSALRFKVAG